MRALVLTAFGGPENFVLQEIPKPRAQPGTLLVKLVATSVNSIDIKIREGGLAIAPPLPAVLGSDIAGIIEEVGEGVFGFSAGDEVYGCAGGVKGLGGTLAEYIMADARLMARKPKTLSMREAAALPLVSITAVQALEKAAPSYADHVLVHGGAGGVGHIGVQLAKVLGCQVAATVGSNEDFDLVRSLGVDEVINFREEKVEAYVERLTSGFGFDVVFDTVGGKNLTASMEAAKAKGRLVTTNARVTIDLTMAHAKALSLHAVFMMLPLITGIGREGHGKRLRYIASLADSGHLHPLLDDEHFTLETAADAHRRLQSGQARGKVVVNLV
jgi:NADPH:quinone reductase